MISPFLYNPLSKNQRIICLFMLVISEITINADTIRCLNDFPEGEVTLVTSFETPILLTCELIEKLGLVSTEDFSTMQLQWSVTSGTIQSMQSIWQWQKPSPGLQTVTVTGYSNSDKIFDASKRFLIPHIINTTIQHNYNNYDIGKYPDPTNLDDLHEVDEDSRKRIQINADSFLPPTLFYEVNPETYSLKIFGKYTLGEFDLDPRFTPLQYPRYIAIHHNLIQLIHELESFLRMKELSFDKLNIIYGFRSPLYNQSSINSDKNDSLKEPFSLHMYGKAIDFIIDDDGDLIMDDINHDGKISFEDGIELANLIAEFEMSLINNSSILVGGVGVYYHHDYWERGFYAQSPYIHIDVRGFTRDDGMFIRWIGKDVISINKNIPPYPKPNTIPTTPIIQTE